MSQINPFTGSLILSGQIQPRQNTDKERQIRRLQNLGKNAALQGDRLEHQVESADALVSIHDEGNSPQQNKKRPQPQVPKQGEKSGESGDAPHIDLTA